MNFFEHQARARGGRRIGTGQGDAATAAWMQEAGVQGIAVAGQAMPAVVVEHRRDEVQLDVGAFVGGHWRTDETTGLGEIAGARPATAAQEVVDGGPQLAGAVIAHARHGMAQRADVQVVLQVAADLWLVQPYVDAVPAQFVGRADAREHQQLR